jgi:predicted nucleic acid-binding protein
MILPSKSPYHHIWTDFLNGNLEICVSSEILLEYEEIISEKISSNFAALKQIPFPKVTVLSIVEFINEILKKHQ